MIQAQRVEATALALVAAGADVSVDDALDDLDRHLCKPLVPEGDPSIRDFRNLLGV